MHGEEAKANWQQQQQQSRLSRLCARVRTFRRACNSATRQGSDDYPRARSCTHFPVTQFVQLADQRTAPRDLNGRRIPTVARTFLSYPRSFLFLPFFFSLHLNRGQRQDVNKNMVAVFFFSQVTNFATV
jgi:hypothetical protein